MQLFGETLSTGTIFFLVLAVGLALFFEAINGFHDTANAVATVIYTHSLKPTVAVVWSGLCNLLGVLLSSGTVAYTVVALLPADLVDAIGSGSSYAMIFSILISAIIWNFGTWYIGLPNSSSHALIGSILGISIAHGLLSPDSALNEALNWEPVKKVFSALLISPLVGFCCAAALLLLGKLLIQKPELFEPADETKTPPLWVRCLLILTCTGVSFAHGSNDGQKGMGLLTLILVAILPGVFALNIHSTNVAQVAAASQATIPILEHYASGVTLTDLQAADILTNFNKPNGKDSAQIFPALAIKNQQIAEKLSGKTSFQNFSTSGRRSLRSDMFLFSSAVSKLNKQNQLKDPQEKKTLTSYQKMLETEIQYIPNFVKVAVALALGIGTMFGWKRIVVTVGEKIGKENLSYGQGASAEIVAALTISAADRFGLPVSTTHVLSSGVAGTMAASGSGLQVETLRNIALSWILTLPVCTLLGASMFTTSVYIILNLLGVK
ncbi:inorganic phosphate transporter [Aetokthonos hydrillicola Thurmond2011]|jgi:PiT family inorganic phosphate transporter|uniref:Phosphate transporter n=1 Tax=Aetokthonos hydrillicola Thurmond2011 TaxID=2712845 RepID=A0AAP5I6H9_9CYAN|nr:inorganic phosphate transporter [Aetokthonos hydrillicola]MBO3457647.1 inorganic phosphate transporter [Aetokthonos hydrillicola CCALA 1050]MBW4587926.1 inorganic phosphate transporter [Aetokthonos hydrillicola CCALA 1050]MDR9894669.1 inorganic phosphate transporter [Aetokthonos hydrillicola Thurmond2011]